MRAYLYSSRFLCGNQIGWQYERHKVVPYIKRPAYRVGSDGQNELAHIDGLNPHVCPASMLVAYYTRAVDLFYL